MTESNASAVMTRAVQTVGPDLSIAELIETLRDKSYSGFPVVDHEGRAIGLVSQNDVLRAVAFLVGETSLSQGFASGRRKASVELLGGNGHDDGLALAGFVDRPVAEIMSVGVYSCAPETPLAAICEMMVAQRIHRVVVCDGDNRVVGIVSATDLVRHYGEALSGS